MMADGTLHVLRRRTSSRCVLCCAAHAAEGRCALCDAQGAWTSPAQLCVFVLKESLQSHLSI